MLYCLIGQGSTSGNFLVEVLLVQLMSSTICPFYKSVIINEMPKNKAGEMRKSIIPSHRQLPPRRLNRNTGQELGTLAWCYALQL